MNHTVLIYKDWGKWWIEVRLDGVCISVTCAHSREGAIEEAKELVEQYFPE